MKILTNYDFNQNQVLNMVIQKLATAPITATSGQMYYNTAQNRMYYYDGSTWKGSDALDAAMSGADIIQAINDDGSGFINLSRLPTSVVDAISMAHSTHAIADVTGLQTALDGKVDDSQVLTNVPSGALFTDTTTSINGKTGVIAKADIVALGIPAQDTTYADATTSVHGLMAATDKTKLNGIASGANYYVHPSGDGNIHVPTTGTSNDGKVLAASSTAGAPTWVTPTVAWTNVSSKPTSTTSAIDTAVTNSHTHSNKSTLDTYTQTNANLTEAVNKRHNQNTDSGTSCNTFQIGGMGTRLTYIDQHTLGIMDYDDFEFANLKVKTIILTGESTTIDSNIVNIGDNQIVLNSDINSPTLNESGGIAVKRLQEHPSGGDPIEKNAELNFNNITGKWETISGSVDTTLITAQIANKVSTTIGDGSATSFAVTHNLHTRDVLVSIRETNDDYEQVIADVRMTTEDTITVYLATAPTLNQYTVTIIG